MSRELRGSAYPHRRRNFAAAIVAGGAIVFLYYNFQSVTAEDHKRVARVSRLSHQVTLAKTQEVKTAAVPEPREMLVDSASAGQANRLAIQYSISQLQRGIDRLNRCPSYTAIFERQERIDGELKDEQQIELKLRHAPFSVYMKWLNGDKGRELLYSDSQNEGKMLVKLGGLKGRLVPTLKIDPTSDRAKSESRHSVAEAGLQNLARQIIQHRERDLKTGNIPTCTIEENHTFDGRSCQLVMVEYTDQKYSPLYRKSLTLIDSELSLPVFVKNYTWPNEHTVDEEQETLIEYYSYTELHLEDRLADAIWQQDNPDYRFKR